MSLLHAAPLDQLTDIKDASKSLAHAVDRGNRKVATEKLKELPEVVRALREEEADMDVSRKKQIEDGLTELRDAVDRELNASQNLLDHPNDIAAKKQFKNAESDVENAVDNIICVLVNKHPDIEALEKFEIEPLEFEDDLLSIAPPVEDEPLDLEAIVPPPG